MSEMAKTADAAPPADAFDNYVHRNRSKGATVGMVGAVVDQMFALLTAAAARIQRLEQRPALKHVGAWRAGSTYAAGNLVQHRGGCWLAKHDTTARPGEADESSRAWILVAKSGRDADDTRALRAEVARLTHRLDALERERR